MKRKVAFIGFGSLGNQLFGFLNEELNINDSSLFFDDIKFKKGDKRSLPFNDFLNDEFKDYEFCIALGYKHLSLKAEIISKLIFANRKLLTFIHPTSFIHSTATLGKGVVVYPKCNIDQNVIVGSGVFLNNSVTISHDSSIGEVTFLAPGVIINGDTKIGTGTFIGSGSLISNSIKIGENVIIGIGTTVTKDIPDNNSVIGNPMKFLKKKIDLV